jgi:hypothetical protein
MAKLSPQQIREIVQKFSQGVPVSSLAKEFDITNMVVYYHTKKYKVYKYRKPTCYKDYIINSIYKKQQEIQFASPDKVPFIRDEIMRLENSLHIKREQCSADPFLFQ